MPRNKTIPRLFVAASFSAGLTAAGLACLPAPAAAQATVEELTVVGRYGPGDRPQSLSQAVSYADLDLATAADRDRLKHRISLTARYLCDRLGENETASGPVPSCRDEATRNAMAAMRPIIRDYKRGARVAAVSPWRAPYPADWETMYPDEPYGPY